MNKLWTLLAVLVATAASPALADVFLIEAGSKGNLVKVHSEATMESFDIKTDQLHGTIELDPAAVGDAIQFELTVDLASLDSGISLRNKHMRENHLETKEFPQAVFRGGKVLKAATRDLTSGKSAAFQIEGEFELHGVKKTIQVDVDVMKADGGLRLVAEFGVPLADYDISRPKFLFMKLAKVQQVRVEALALLQTAPAQTP